MASLRDSPVASRAPVCLTCGDKEDAELLIYCRNCRDSAVHHYCLDNFSPDDDNIKWWCWDCEVKDTHAEPLRKSKRISSKRRKVLETRNNWKWKLNQKKRQVQISNEISETDRLTIDGHLSISGVETKFVNERQSDQEISEEEKLIPDVASYLGSGECNESNEIDEPIYATKSTLPHKQVNNMESSDKTLKIQESGQKKRNLLLKDSSHAQNEGKTINLHLSSLAYNDHCTTSDKLSKQPSLEADDCLSAEPIITPIWRGCFNIKEESGTCVEILAHLSNKACLKVSDTAIAMPLMLDIELLDKRAVWPKSFRATPPTASSIALYFFPASERDERIYDSLLDDVIERDLALKIMIDNVELLIFSSIELPLQLWRYNSKYFLWGVFRKKQRSCSSAESAASTQRNNNAQFSELSESTDEANDKDLIDSQYADDASESQPNQRSLSMKSSQSSNVVLSKHDSPDSIA